MATSAPPTRPARARKLPPTLTAPPPGDKAPPPALPTPQSPLSPLRLPENVRIRYADSPAEAAALLRLPAFRAPHLGFDIEWRAPLGRNQKPGPVALLQLSAPTTIALLHLCHMPTLPSELVALLESRSTIKLGVNIKGDARKLYKDYGVKLNGMVDLAPLAKRLADEGFDLPDDSNGLLPFELTQVQAREGLKEAGKGRASLQSLTEGFCRHTLLKGPQIRRSNWEARPLSRAQYLYAAVDAFAALAVFDALCRFRRPVAAPIQQPPPPSGSSPAPVPHVPGPWDALLPPAPSLQYSTTVRYVVTELSPGRPASPPKPAFHPDPVRCEPVHFAEVLEAEAREADARAREAKEARDPKKFVRATAAQEADDSAFAAPSEDEDTQEELDGDPVEETAEAFVDAPEPVSDDYEMDIDFSRLTEDELRLLDAQAQDAERRS